jgi:hypothetical protein
MSADEIELAWMRLCNGSEFLPEQTVKEFSRELKKVKRRAAFHEGLREFVEARCPRCHTRGRFRVGSMGKMTHPGCTAWTMPAGAYMARVALQVAPTLAAIPFRVLAAAAENARPPRHPMPPPPPPDPRPACPVCGTRFDDDDRFCPRCGRRRPQS